MASFRFVHAADVHLDSPLRGLEMYPGAPVERLRGATRQAFENLVQLCIREQVAFLIIAGDLFDTDCKDFQAALWAARQLQKLQRVGIPVYVILGNHDSHMEQNRQVPWPSNVKLFDHTMPESVKHPTLPVALHGMSYPTRELRENLVPRYPQPLSGCFNIGLLHTNAGGNTDHDPYAPCSIEELVAKRYDYWALGHVHDNQVLHPQPMIAYSGNTQGRPAREVGTKGCFLVSVNDASEVAYEFRETDVARWAQLNIQLAEGDGETDLREKVRSALISLQAANDGKLLATRLTISGRTNLHASLARDAECQQIIANLRADASELSDDIWIEKIKFFTQSPIDREALRSAPGLIGQMLRDLEAMKQQTAAPADLKELIQPLLTFVGSDWQADPAMRRTSTSDGVASSSEISQQQMQTWLSAAEEVLLSALGEERS